MPQMLVTGEGECSWRGIWVRKPMTPTVTHPIKLSQTRAAKPMNTVQWSDKPRTPPRQMVVYPVQLTQSGQVKQECTLMLIVKNGFSDPTKEQ